MKPPWMKLIDQWEENHFGLSIPFIFGALCIECPDFFVSNLENVERMRTLLRSIRDDTPDDITMRLFTCDRTQELILRRIHDPPYYLIEIPSPTRSRSALYVEKGIFAESDDTFETLVSELWRRYGDNIEAGRYSVHAGKFRAFNDEEKNWIQEAFSKPDDDY